MRSNVRQRISKPVMASCDPDRDRARREMETMTGMVRIDLAAVERAADGG